MAHKTYNLQESLRSLSPTTVHPLEVPVVQPLIDAIIDHMLTTQAKDALIPDLTKDTHTAAERERVFNVFRSIKEGVHPNCYPDVIHSYMCQEYDDGFKVCKMVIYFRDDLISGTASMGMPSQVMDRPSIWEKAQTYSDIPLMRDTLLNDTQVVVTEPVYQKVD